MILSQSPENNSVHRDTDSIHGRICVSRTSPYVAMLIQQTFKNNVYRHPASFHSFNSVYRLASDIVSSVSE